MKQEIQNRINQINRGIVPEGYKETDFGIFPIDWETDKKLGDIGEFARGKGLPGNKMLDRGIECIGYGDIYTKYNYYFDKALNYVDQETANQSCKIYKGTLLFTASGETADEIGKCVCYTGENPIYAGGDIITFVTNKVNPLFLAYQQYQKFSLMRKAQLGQGHSVVHIYENSLSRLPVAYPNKASEQSKIAEVLMACDKAVELQKQYIDMLELRKKAVMQKLLTPQSDWKLVTLKNVLKERSIFSEKGKGYEHVTLCKEGVMPKTDRYERDFLVVDENKKYKITKVNDICYNPANLKFGVICINKYKEGIFSPIYVTYEVKEGYNADFISYLVTSNNFIEKIRKYEEGSVYERMAVKSSDFLKGKVYIPCLNIQNEIADSVQLLDKQIELEKQKLQLLINRQKSLQQLLLTGIVRVI